MSIVLLNQHVCFVVVYRLTMRFPDGFSTDETNNNKKYLTKDQLLFLIIIIYFVFVYENTSTILSKLILASILKFQ